MFFTFGKWLADKLFLRLAMRMLNSEPDFIVGGKETPYMLRWFVIPRNRFFNIYLHRFLRSDDDRAHHDHPWLFNASFLLQGRYIEHVIHKGGTDVKTGYSTGNLRIRLGAAPHRIELIGSSCVTLFITGPVVRVWRFHCPHGYVNWKDFVDSRDAGAIGKGCGD